MSNQIQINALSDSLRTPLERKEAFVDNLRQHLKSTGLDDALIEQAIADILPCVTFQNSIEL